MYHNTVSLLHNNLHSSLYLQYQVVYQDHTIYWYVIAFPALPGALNHYQRTVVAICIYKQLFKVLDFLLNYYSMYMVTCDLIMIASLLDPNGVKVPLHTLF